LRSNGPKAAPNKRHKPQQTNDTKQTTPNKQHQTNDTKQTTPNNRHRTNDTKQTTPNRMQCNWLAIVRGDGEVRACVFCGQHRREHSKPISVASVLALLQAQHPLLQTEARTLRNLCQAALRALRAPRSTRAPCATSARPRSTRTRAGSRKTARPSSRRASAATTGSRAAKRRRSSSRCKRCRGMSTPCARSAAKTWTTVS